MVNLEQQALLLSVYINQNDTLFSNIDNAINYLCEEQGFNPDDFEFTIDVYVKETTVANECTELNKEQNND